MLALQGLLVAGFMAVHLFAGKLRFLSGIPRSRWLSMAGGSSVAYVFLHVFPELQEVQGTLEEGAEMWPGVEHHAYLVALFGLVVFYGLERLVKATQRQRGETRAMRRPRRRAARCVLSRLQRPDRLSAGAAGRRQRARAAAAVLRGHGAALSRQ